MLSIFYSLIWGHAAGINVGAFLGGVMMQGKHNYKRENPKQKALDKDHDRRVKLKYPNIVDEKNRAAGVIAAALATLNGLQSTDNLDTATATLKSTLVAGIINEDNFAFFKDVRFRTIKVDDSADLDGTQAAYNAVYDTQITTALTKVRADNVTARTALENRFNDVLNAAPPLAQGPLFQAETAIIRNTTTGQVIYNSFDTAKTNYNTLLTNSGLTAGAFQAAAVPNNGTNIGNGVTAAQATAAIANLNTTGQGVVAEWTREKTKQDFITKATVEITKGSLKLDDPLQKAEKAFQEELDAAASADEYAPVGSDEVPLPTPSLNKEPGEADNWETLEGEEKSKRIGFVYGLSAGYQKELAKHALAGFEVFAKKDMMTVKYELKVKDRAQAFGTLEAKPGYTFGVTIIAGKHLNPVFAIFGRGTFEFTRWKFAYDANNDAPHIKATGVVKQELGSWIKQAAVGVGARYNMTPSISVEACYDFIPATKTTVRNFSEVGADQRRRGYAYTNSQHRVLLKVVKFFNV